MSLSTIINDIAPVKPPHNPYKGSAFPQPFDASVQKGTRPLSPEEEKVAKGLRMDAKEYAEYRDHTEEAHVTQAEVDEEVFGGGVENEYKDENYVPDLPDHFPKQEEVSAPVEFGVDPLEL